MLGGELGGSAPPSTARPPSKTRTFDPARLPPTTQTMGPGNPDSRSTLVRVGLKFWVLSPSLAPQQISTRTKQYRDSGASRSVRRFAPY